MKTLFTIFLAIFLGNTAFGQFGEYIIDFDSPNSMNNHIIIDTVSNPNNIWQIGVPSKTVFGSAYSLTHAIVTDTLNPYPVNDTSSFILKHIRPEFLGGNESLQLNFWFQFNADPLTDFGMVEASIDNGITWVNLLTDDITYELQWLEPKPVLTGNSNGWQHFALELNMLTYNLGYSDTLLYRFTFISDGVQTNKDGWMIDDFQLADWWEGINEYSNNDMIYVYPNPTQGEVSIVNNSEKITDYSLEIIDIGGETVLRKETHANNFRLDLPNGLYFIKLTDKENIYLKKLIIKK
jgi:hypothetical protein